MPVPGSVTTRMSIKPEEALVVTDEYWVGSGALREGRERSRSWLRGRERRAWAIAPRRLLGRFATSLAAISIETFSLLQNPRLYVISRPVSFLLATCAEFVLCSLAQVSGFAHALGIVIWVAVGVFYRVRLILLFKKGNLGRCRFRFMEIVEVGVWKAQWAFPSVASWMPFMTNAGEGNCGSREVVIGCEWEEPLDCNQIWVAFYVWFFCVALVVVED